MTEIISKTAAKLKNKNMSFDEFKGNSWILIVDDDESNCFIMKAMLEGFGYANVKTATSAEGAFDAELAHDIDLILMDIDLSSEMDGIDLFQKMKGSATASIIYVTGYFSGQMMEKARDTLPSAILLKPYDPGLLNANIEIALHARMIKKENVKLGNTIIQLIEAMEKTIALKDPYTSGHQIRVAKLAKAIAVEMDLPGEKIDGIYYTALVHEYGKIFVPAEILSKPGKLSERQFRFILDHPVKGSEALADIDFPWPVADIILQHHERIDGSGYPRNLKGEEILIEARVIAVADVISSMTSYKPYRHALGIGEALEEIEKNSGRLYDSTVVRVCLDLFMAKKFSF